MSDEGNDVPYLGQITITGPEPELGRRQHFVDALAAAMTEGWRSLRKVLDHRIIGYPGGAVITVVLDGDGLDFEEAAAALASLGRHLTTWSPELLAYRLQQVEVAKLDHRWDEEHWLPPLDHDRADDRPAWPLPVLMGDPLQELAAQYLVAGAVRSVWEPGKRVNYPSFTARDVALGAAEYPWHREITTALGAMLIQAARREAEDNDYAPLIVAEGASREFADDLVQRARQTADDATDGFADDQMRGQLLLQSFVEAHELGWTPAADDDNHDRREAHRSELLRQLLDAGFGALATMCAGLQDVRSPWELAVELTDDPVVAVITDLESDRIDEDIDSDTCEVWAAATSHAAVWAAIHRPDLLDIAVGAELLDDLTGSIDTLHQVVHSALVMLGDAVIAAALEDPTLPPILLTPIRNFIAAQRAIRDEDYEGDAIDDMHCALETALGHDDPGPERLREVLCLITIAAPLTGTDANPELGQQGYISSPSQLSSALLRHADEHAALDLSPESHGDGGARLATIAVLAALAPEAAGAMAAQLPILDQADPRSEPAARDQALRWIHNAIEQTNALETEASPDPDSSDARLVLTSARDHRPIPSDWPARRFVAAAAEASAAVLQPMTLEDAAGAIEVFTGS
ncbi:hypothetical protein [Catenulispora pinisilvae]|uniref:hypothetical protein n=1 Tax=Catenulispora pinisilvae TaxID=2705253 RepID=UPI00189191EF|nr:hypothetical protein [Catenulispora pinisilvae]